MRSQHITIGSRGSDLALWQANHVKQQLSDLGYQVTIEIIKTQGDLIQHLSFDKMEGKGFFTKEIEAALLDKKIDLAVHSHKDLETSSPKGLIIGAVSEREDPSDLLLIRKESADVYEKWHLTQGKTIGTSSARRKSQLLHHRPDLKITDLRGNVPTRIQKLREGVYDAILLASAGVNRLQLDVSEFVVYRLAPEVFVPAPAQGVLALQIREDDVELKNSLIALHSVETAQKIAIERKVMQEMDGGCQLPLGVYCPNLREVHVSYAKSSNEEASVKKYMIQDTATISTEIVRELRAQRV